MNGDEFRLGESHVPWNDEQVRNLQAFQDCPSVHPFTGENSAGRKVNLIPTNAGWIAEPGGAVVQDWAHDFMTDGSAVRNAERQREAFAKLLPPGRQRGLEA